MIKPIIGAIAATIVAAPLALADQHAPTLETDVDRFSYAIGLRTAEGMMSQDLTLDVFSPQAFALALEDVMSGNEPRLTEDQMMAALQAISQAVAAAAADRQREAAQEGVVFMEQNASADGIVTTDSGLQYRVDTMGDGAKPAVTDVVSVHYAGRLLDGSEFDSSYGRGEPAQFPVNAVIPGWTEVLQLMPVGSKYEIWIPQELAYGERGAPPAIPPFAVLNFTVELLEIVGQ